MSLQSLSAMTLKGAISVIANQDLRERETTVQVGVPMRKVYFTPWAQ